MLFLFFFFFVAGCADLSRFKKTKRNSYIHDCLQKTASLTWCQNVEYCWECFQFCDQENYT